MKTITLASIIACLSLVQAASRYDGTVGFLLPGPGDDAASYEYFAEVNHNTSTRTTVTRNVTADAPLGIWQWTMAVSQVPSPNSPGDIGQANANYSEGYKITNTEYELIWPGRADNTSFQEYLEQQRVNASINILRGVLPSDYKINTTSDPTGDCATYLGIPCTSDLYQLPGHDYPFTWVPTGACSGSVGKMYNDLGSQEHYPLASYNASSTSALYPGDALLYLSTRYTGNDAVQAYHNATIEINVLKLAFVPYEGSGEQVLLFCQISNVTAAQLDSTTGAAPRGIQISAMLGLVVLISMLATAV